MTGVAVVALLGVYHGLNPAMGWLFAVALGLQEERWSAVLRALPPIAAGHALAIAPVVALAGAVSVVVPAGTIRIVGAAALLAFAAFLLLRRSRHPRWIGMRASARDLTLWSFIMSNAHGSGLMLLPLLLPSASHDGATHATHASAAYTQAAAGDGLLVLAVHTSAMLLALTTAALLAYHILGLGFLRRAWINLDVVWIGALVLAAAATLLG